MSQHSPESRSNTHTAPTSEHDPSSPGRSRQHRDRGWLPDRQPPPPRPSPSLIAITLANAGAEYLRASVYFDLDSSRLGPAEGAVLARATGLLNTRTLDSIQAIGHTDASGEEAHNDDLSLRRALSVVDQMDPLLLPQNRDVLSSLAMGEETAAGAPAHCRRVDIVSRVATSAAAAHELPLEGPLPGHAFVAPWNRVGSGKEERAAALLPLYERHGDQARKLALAEIGMTWSQIQACLAAHDPPLKLDDIIHQRQARSTGELKATATNSDRDDLPASARKMPLTRWLNWHVTSFRLAVLDDAWNQSLVSDLASREAIDDLTTALSKLEVPPDASTNAQEVPR